MVSECDREALFNRKLLTFKGAIEQSLLKLFRLSCIQSCLLSRGSWASVEHHVLIFYSQELNSLKGTFRGSFIAADFRTCYRAQIGHTHLLRIKVPVTPDICYTGILGGY